MSDFIDLLSHVDSEEEQAFSREAFDQTIMHFRALLRDTAVAGVYLTEADIADTWRLTEGLLVEAGFHGTLLILCEAQGWQYHIPFFPDGQKEAVYSAYSMQFEMHMVDSFDGIAELGLLITGGATPDTLPAYSNVQCKVLSLSNSEKRSFILGSFLQQEPEKRVQSVYFNLEQFRDAVHAESLPFFKVSSALLGGIDPGIHDYYLQLSDTATAAKEAGVFVNLLDAEAAIILLPMSDD